MIKRKSQALCRNEEFLILQVQNKMQIVAIVEEAVALKEKNTSYGSSSCLKLAIRKEVEKIISNRGEGERIIRTNAYRSFVKQQAKKSQEFINKMKKLG